MLLVGLGGVLVGWSCFDSCFLASAEFIVLRGENLPLSVNGFTQPRVLARSQSAVVVLGLGGVPFDFCIGGLIRIEDLLFLLGGKGTPSFMMRFIRRGIFVSLNESFRRRTSTS